MDSMLYYVCYIVFSDSHGNHRRRKGVRMTSQILEVIHNKIMFSHLLSVMNYLAM